MYTGYVHGSNCLDWTGVFLFTLIILESTDSSLVRIIMGNPKGICSDFSN